MVGINDFIINKIIEGEFVINYRNVNQIRIGIKVINLNVAWLKWMEKKLFVSKFIIIHSLFGSFGWLGSWSFGWFFGGSFLGSGLLGRGFSRSGGAVWAKVVEVGIRCLNKLNWVMVMEGLNIWVCGGSIGSERSIRNSWSDGASQRESWGVGIWACQGVRIVRNWAVHL